MATAGDFAQSDGEMNGRFAIKGSKHRASCALDNALDALGALDNALDNELAKGSDATDSTISDGELTKKLDTLSIEKTSVGELTRRSVLTCGSGEPEEGGDVNHNVFFNDLTTKRSSTNAKAIALYDYEAKEDDELSFDPDDIITIIEKTDYGWWLGSLNGKTGLFPSNYVEEIEEERKKQSGQPKNDKTTSDIKYKVSTRKMLQTGTQRELTAASLTKGCRIAMTIRLPREGYRVWLSKDEKTVFVGGYQIGILMVVQNEGDSINEIPIRIIGKDIKTIASGFCLGTHEHVITISMYTEKGKIRAKLFHIVLNASMTSIEKLSEIDVTSPQLLFDYSNENLGVYCPKRQKDGYERICVVNKQTLQICKAINVESNGYPHCFGTSISRTGNGEYFLSDHNHNVLHKYHSDGRYKESIGESAQTPGLNKLGVLWHPRHICSFTDGSSVLVCGDGALHILEEGKWHEFMTLKTHLNDVAISHNRVFTVLGGDLMIYNIIE